MVDATLRTTMKFWDSILQFHEFVHKDYTNGTDGLAAVRFLRDVFEPSWKEEGSRRHPLVARVAQASEESYRSIIESARKVGALETIPGFTGLQSRLGDPDEYAAAGAEMEVALMLRLGGFDVAFVEAGHDPAPDLSVQRGGRKFAVEVSSLNPPVEDARLNDAVGRVIFAGFTKAVTTGGVISRPPSDAELKAIDTNAKAAIQRVIEGHCIERVSLSGLATIYAAPRDLAGQLPEDCRGQFRTIPLYRGPPEEKIARALRNKLGQLGSGDPSVLFLFDRFLGAEALLKLFETAGDDVGVVVSSVPALMALAVVAPLNLLPGPHQPSRKSAAAKTMMRVQIGVREWADVLAWDNKHADERQPSAVLDCIECYNGNLGRLRSLETCGSPQLDPEMVRPSETQ